MHVLVYALLRAYSRVHVMRVHVSVSMSVAFRMNRYTDLLERTKAVAGDTPSHPPLQHHCLQMVLSAKHLIYMLLTHILSCAYFATCRHTTC